MSKRIKNKTRVEVVWECYQACKACWEHYSGITLSPLEKQGILSALEDVLPRTINTNDWRKAKQTRKDEDAKNQGEEN